MTKWPRMTWKATEIGNKVLKHCFMYMAGVCMYTSRYTSKSASTGKMQLKIEGKEVWGLIFCLVKIANLPEHLMSSLIQVRWLVLESCIHKYTVNIVTSSNISSAKNLNTLTHLLHDIYYGHLPIISPSINVRLTLMKFELTHWINDFD